MAIEYKYDVLSAEGDSKPTFRLMELVSDKPAGLEIKVHTFSLDDAPPYDALSYCWGTNERGESIIVLLGDDGETRRLPVTRNLLLGLRKIFENSKRNDSNRKYRKSYSSKSNDSDTRNSKNDIRYSRFMWVDAICINQADAWEKEHQVPMMCKIYSQAQKTVVWLGEPRLPKGDESCRWLIDQTSKLLFRPYTSNGQPNKTNVLRLVLTAYLRQKYSKTLFQFAIMVSNEWFSRAWVIQEVAVASSVVVLYGSEVFKWDELIRSSTIFSGQRFGESPHAWHHIRQLDRIRRRWHGNGTLTLYDLVRSAGSRMTSQDRDCIYSLLSLAKDTESLSISPDYCLDTSDSDVFVEFACRMVTNGKELGLLGERRSSGVHGLIEGRNVMRLPSWVPDWRVDASMFSMTEQAERNSFRAGGESSLWAQVEGNRRLRLKGVSLEIIVADKSNPYSDTKNSEEGFVDYSNDDVIGSFFSEDDEILRHFQESPYFTDEDHFDVLWQVFIVGAPPDRFKEVKAHFHFMRDTHADLKRVTNWISFKQTVTDWLRFAWTLTRRAKPLFISGIPSDFTDLTWRLHKRLALTTCGALSLAPKITRTGDRLFFAQGCQFPIVVRPLSDDQYTFLGAAYTHGYMYGEVWEAKKYQAIEEIVLV